MTFPPICVDPAPVPPQGGQQVGAARGGWTATGTVVEPRCLFPTRTGDTCPPNWCNMLPTFDRIFCAPRTLVAPTCIACQPQQRQVGFAGGGFGGGAPFGGPGGFGGQGGFGGGGFGGGGFGGPTPTATFPPVCGDPTPWQPPQMPTIYPQHTCGFVCNTQFPPCGHPQEAAAPGAGAGGAQVGAAWTNATCLEPRCFFPTQSGDTCPRNWCNIIPTFERIFCAPRTLAGNTCPRGWCNPWPMQQQAQQQPQPQPQQQQQFGAVGGGGTLVSPRCLRSVVDCPPTRSGETCPPTICSIFGVGCPRPPRRQVGAAGFAPPHPTMSQVTCDAFHCQPTFFGETCPVDQCMQPTMFGMTCPVDQCMQPTMFGMTCPVDQCPQPTMFGMTCPVDQCMQPTMFGMTCPVDQCMQPTMFGMTCPADQCMQPTMFGMTCPMHYCRW